MKQRGRTWSRCAEGLIDRCVRPFWAGLVIQGRLMAGEPHWLHPYDPQAVPALWQRLDGPPPGHPERLCAEPFPAELERMLHGG
ncbi:DUF6059 family protein [Streptomyces sp. NPDC059544]|uniref:DUF6059 family protein n=1 Tax=Streptomyces sp. NPDC059544 TaxID=3346861 RepID=UPI00368DBE6B